MSGHSKWSQIKRKKGLKDQQKGKIFSKFSRLITLAVAEGGGIADPEKNFKLRLSIERARAENMPKETIERAIEKAKNPVGNAVREVIYEGFGPGGISLIITAATDNPNRSHAEVRNVLEKHNGKIGAVNSVQYLFDKCGVVVFAKDNVEEGSAFGFADKIGAYDIEDSGDVYIVYVPFETLGRVKDYIDAGIKPETIDIFYRPKTLLPISAEEMEKSERLIEALEDLDDVDKVYSNGKS